MHIDRLRRIRHSSAGLETHTTAGPETGVTNSERKRQAAANPALVLREDQD